MSTTSAAEGFGSFRPFPGKVGISASANEVRPRVPQADPASAAFEARRRAILSPGNRAPLERVGAFLLAISRNNGHEGRDPALIPETLTCRLRRRVARLPHRHAGKPAEGAGGARPRLDPCPFGPPPYRPSRPARGQQFAVAGDVRHHRHAAAVEVLEHDDRAAANPIEFKHHGRRFEFRIDRLLNTQELVGKIRLDHAQEAAQALIVDIRSGHLASRTDTPAVRIVAEDCVPVLRKSRARSGIASAAGFSRVGDARQPLPQPTAPSIPAGIDPNCGARTSDSLKLTVLALRIGDVD